MNTKYIDLILKKLEKNKKSIYDQWCNPLGTNTKHFIIDNFLPKKEVDLIFQGFPTDGKGFNKRKTFREKKRTSAQLSEFDDILSEITYAFQDEKVVKKVGALINFKDLEPDPMLYAGGLSMMFPGDFLNPHIDNSHDSRRKKYRRLNLLYYVSPNWKLENGGNFELWSSNRKKPKTIVSLQNRLVVMETNLNSWHSVSKVLTNRPRCCVSNYYFSKISPNNKDYFHVTSFSGRPNEFIKNSVGFVDNFLRNSLSKLLKYGRGKSFTNTKHHLDK